MTHVGRKQKDIALPQRNTFESLVVRDQQPRVAAQLVEKLLERIIVKVGSLVGPADERHDQIGAIVAASGRFGQPAMPQTRAYRIAGAHR